MNRRRVKHAVLALALAALVGGTAAGCDDKGTVIKAEIYGAVGEKCALTIRPDGVDPEGNPKAVFILKGRRSTDCKRCPKGARWPECMKKEVPGGAPANRPGTGDARQPDPTVRIRTATEDPALIRVVNIHVSSTQAGYNVYYTIYGRYERERDSDGWEVTGVETSRSIPVFASDELLIVKASNFKHPDAVYDCEIRASGGAVIGEAAGAGAVECRALIRAHFAPR